MQHLTLVNKVGSGVFTLQFALTYSKFLKLNFRTVNHGLNYWLDLYMICTSLYCDFLIVKNQKAHELKRFGVRNIT